MGLFIDWGGVRKGRKCVAHIIASGILFRCVLNYSWRIWPRSRVVEQAEEQTVGHGGECTESCSILFRLEYGPERGEASKVGVMCVGVVGAMEYDVFLCVPKEAVWV